MLSQLSISETIAVITALVYVLLAARSNIWCWFWGIISCSFWAYSAFFDYDLYVDALLQVFYVLIAFVGIYQWKYGSKSNANLEISVLRKNMHVMIVIGGLVLSAIVGFFFAEYTQAAATYLDSFTTIFSVIATILLVRRVLENWVYWIIVDATYIYLYASRGGILFTALFVIYTAMAIYGYYNWRKEYLEPSVQQGDG
ncbi:MAG: nicotinamide mononucleotide transporter [Bacteroidia bacterium]|nr:nicotinamide mononucleotide transporter [Bacteroidia bacterium]